MDHEAQTTAATGELITVRLATLDDVDRIVEMYQRMSPEDLHRRFFSGFRPDRAFVERWVDRRRSGGAVLIAVLGDPEHGRIIADAGYIPTGTDIAELAITVEPARRGWLGPYLLDVLIEHARANGVIDLEAEVLTNNCGMLAMLRARGCAFQPSDDPAVAHVLIGTSGAAPSWPQGRGHPQILIEGSMSSWSGARVAEREGMAVLVCPGPERGRMHTCPRLVGEPCPLADGADAVIVALPRAARTTAPLLDAHARYPGSQPIALSPQLRELYEDVPGHPALRLEPLSSGDDAVAAVRQALEASEDAAEPSSGEEPGQTEP